MDRGFDERSDGSADLEDQESFLAELEAFEAQNNVTPGSVKLEGLALMKILQHGSAKMPMEVTGQLLGLNVGEVLEVTDCFPFPTKDEEESNWGDAEASTEEADTQYQLNMMRMLKEVNVDCNTVGWYLCSFRGSFLDINLLDTQFNYQREFGKKCVCIMYDPMKTAQGVLSVRAMRLTDEFMEVYASNKDSFFRGASLNSYNVFEELPISIHNSALSRALVTEMMVPGRGGGTTRAYSSDAYLEKNMELMIEHTDYLQSELIKYHGYLRRFQDQESRRMQHVQKLRQENELRKESGQQPLAEEEEELSFGAFTATAPSRLESIVTNSLVNSFSSNITQFAKSGFSKLFMLEGLQRSSSSTGEGASAD